MPDDVDDPLDKCATTSADSSTALCARLSQEAARATDPDAFLERLVHLLRDGLPADFVEVYLRHPHDATFVRRAHAGWPDGGAPAAEMQPGDLPRRVAQAGDVLFVEDLKTQQDGRAPAYLLEAGVRSSLAAAIGGTAATRGLVAVHAQQPSAFAPASGSVLETAAALTRLVMEGVGPGEPSGDGQAAASLPKRSAAEQDLLRGILNHAPMNVALLRGPENVFEIINEAERRWLGGRDVLGRPIKEALPEVDWTELGPVLDEVYRTGEGITLDEFEVSFRRADDELPERRYFDFCYLPLSEQGRERAIVFLGQEVTERVRNREQLEVLRTFEQGTLVARTSQEVAEVAVPALERLAPFDAMYVDHLDLDGNRWSRLVEVGSREDFFVPAWRSLADYPGLERLVQGEVLCGPVDVAEDGPDAGADASCLRLPLMVGQECIGVLGMARQRAYSSDEQLLIDKVVVALALGMQHTHLVAEKQESMQRLQDLSRRLVETQEEERRYLALELHDQLGQDLAAIHYALDRARTIRGGVGEEHGALLDQAQRLVESLTNQVRALSLRLRPTVLDDMGLRAALAWYTAQYSEQTGIEVEYRHSGLDRHELGRLPATMAYRIVQEALTNVARHAETDRVRLLVMLRASVLLVRIEDDGLGFDLDHVDATRSGGLYGMRERARLVGGELTIEAAPGEGVRISASLPASSAGLR